ncbi:MAG: type II toxin-antitoxin system HicB family antitoxin [Ktedonobacterales bacterium]
MHYTITVKWSDDDQTFVVYLPDWEGLLLQPCADGTTYAEAIQQGQEVLDDMIAVFKREGKQLPPVKAYA